MKGNKGAKRFLVSLIALSMLLTFMGAYFYFSRPNVILGVSFDKQTQIVKAYVLNKGSKPLTFYDTLTLPQPTSSFKNIPRALRVKVFALDKTVLSGPEGLDNGYISIRDADSSFFTLPVKDMGVLLPNQTISVEVKLSELIGKRGLYKDLTKLKDFCIQIKMTLYFNPNFRFPVEKESEVTCLNAGMK